MVAHLGSELVKRVLVIGAAGMIGRKLTERLQREPLAELTLHDVVPSPVPAGAAFSVKTATSDLSAPGDVLAEAGLRAVARRQVEVPLGLPRGIPRHDREAVRVVG